MIQASTISPGPGYGLGKAGFIRTVEDKGAPVDNPASNGRLKAGLILASSLVLVTAALARIDRREVLRQPG
jgi:hypothetical protein